jgi:hypothetical protein
MFVPRLHLDNNRYPPSLDPSRSQSLHFTTMSRDSDQSSVTNSLRELHHAQRTSQRFNASPSIQRTLSNRSPDSIIIDHVNGTARAASYREGVASPSAPGPSEKESQQQGAGASSGCPTIDESVEARIERLGRQRPEVFGSLWAEIGFVFSISMSQVLSVS